MYKILPDRVVAPSKGRYQNQLQKSNMESRPALRLVGGKHLKRMLLYDERLGWHQFHCISHSCHSFCDNMNFLGLLKIVAFSLGVALLKLPFVFLHKHSEATVSTVFLIAAILSVIYNWPLLGQIVQNCCVQLGDSTSETSGFFPA